MEHRDAVEVAMLSGELGYPMAVGLIEERLEIVRASPPHQPADFLVAVDLSGDRVIGWVHVCVPLFLTGKSMVALRPELEAAEVRWPTSLVSQVEAIVDVARGVIDSNCRSFHAAIDRCQE